MAGATLGKIEEFDGSKEEWPQYVERLSFFFTANSITDADKKRAVFLSVVGATTYKVLRDLLSPDKPGEKTFEELVEKLGLHYSPKPSEIVERFKFHTRFRKPGESVSMFIAQLRSLSEHCNFGAVLEDMIRDRLVCGVNDDVIQKRLLAEATLTYAKAVQLVKGLETADKNVKLLKNSKREQEGASGSSPSIAVHQVGKGRGNPTVTCFRCGTPGHAVPRCRMAKDVVCRQCGKAGHIQRACELITRSKKGQGPPPGPKRQQFRANSRPVRRVQEEDDEEDIDTLFHINSKSISPPMQVQVNVDDCLIRMEVDTGASMS